jgi:hypothetical protein
MVDYRQARVYLKLRGLYPLYHCLEDRIMKETLETKNIGLRGIKVADTRISDVDGEKGNLIY